MHLTVDQTPAFSPPPAQLPPSPAIFVGRRAELTALDEMTAHRELALVAIIGSGGAGKTSLAGYWLHGQSGRYPGGALYTDLVGHDPATAANPGDVLAGFLAALGTPPESIPLTLGEQSKMFRSLTAGRKMLILLDNAASAAQVRVLLPGAAPDARTVVLVTTRWKLAGLAMDGARFMDLGPLDEASAVGIIATMAGTVRADAEPDAVRDIVRHCGGLPLAVCVAGAQLAMHPLRPVSRMAADLAETEDRLAALSIPGDISVQAVFDRSYMVLEPRVAHFYRMLSLLFTPDFGADLAAAHAGVTRPEATTMLDTLTGASMLEEVADGRFRYHELMRLHARQHAEAESASEREAAVARAIDWYLREAVRAEKVIAPSRWHLNPMFQENEPLRHATSADALTWLESEMTGLVAAVHAAHDAELHEQTWQLCEALWGLFSRRRYFRQWMETHRVGLESAIACANQPAEARMRVRLGLAYLNLGRHDAAVAEFTRSLDVARQAHHRIGEATALEHMGLALLAEGQNDRAIDCFAEALRIFREIGMPRGALIMTRRMGEAYGKADQHEQAIDCLREARELSVAVGDRFLEGRSLSSLGRAYVKADQPLLAIDTLEEALSIVAETGATYEQARIRSSLADAALALGRTADARQHLAASLAIYSDLGSPEAELVGRLLAELQLSDRNDALPLS